MIRRFLSRADNGHSRAICFETKWPSQLKRLVSDLSMNRSWKIITNSRARSGSNAHLAGDARLSLITHKIRLTHSDSRKRNAVSSKLGPLDEPGPRYFECWHSENQFLSSIRTLFGQQTHLQTHTCVRAPSYARWPLCSFLFPPRKYTLPSIAVTIRCWLTELDNYLHGTWSQELQRCGNIMRIKRSLSRRWGTVGRTLGLLTEATKTRDSFGSFVVTLAISERWLPGVVFRKYFVTVKYHNIYNNNN